MPHTQTIIIGAGPIGIELAVALKQAGHPYLHIDAAQIGHTISWFAPGTHFFSSPERIQIAGVPLVTANQDKATREEYLAYLRAVVAQFDLAVQTYERVESIAPAPDDAPHGARFLITTRLAAGGQVRQYTARNVVLAIGDMHHPRRLNIPGEDLPHVSHYFRDPHEYFRRRVLIVGGRNSAVEAAIRLFRLGASLTLSYRGRQLDSSRIKYWLLPEITWLIEKHEIGWRPCTRPVSISPTQVTLEHVHTGARSEVQAESVLLLTGYEQDNSLLRQCGIELLGPEQAPSHDHVTMQTNIPGLYVAGTATAGTQHRFRVFIETSHAHVHRIVKAITGRDVHAAQPELRYDQPES